VSPALTAPELGQHDVALRSQAGEVLLERAHSLPNAGHPPLELTFIQGTQVL
jgi:hypothetical protein